MATPEKQIIFKWKDIPTLKKKLGGNIDRAIDLAIKQYANELEQKVIREMEDQKAVASGRMKKGLHANIKYAANKVTIRIFNKVGYMKFVDSGTLPHYPPIREIQKWAKKKFGGDKRAAFAIQKSIGLKGTKGKPFIRMVLRKEKQRAAKTIQRYIRRYYK